MKKEAQWGSMVIFHNSTHYQSIKYYLRGLSDLPTLAARINALVSVSIVILSLSARRWCCLAFLARFGAKRVSLSANASLNLSALDNSLEFMRVGDMDFGVNPQIAHVWGSTSLTKWSSIAISGNASLGTSNPLNPKGDGFGLTMIRGHSVERISRESLSIFGCKERNWVSVSSKKIQM